jgi:hypothetical protein
VTEQQGGVPVALKMLLRGPPERAENVERAYLYVAGQAPAELPVEDFQRAPRPPSPKSRQVKRAGRKDLVLAAGRFRCDVLRVEGARLYRSGQVPLWGMVRAVTREQRVELVGFGDVGAVSVFPPGFDQGKGSESAK